MSRCRYSAPVQEAGHVRLVSLCHLASINRCAVRAAQEGIDINGSDVWRGANDAHRQQVCARLKRHNRRVSPHALVVLVDVHLAYSLASNGLKTKQAHVIQGMDYAPIYLLYLATLAPL